MPCITLIVNGIVQGVGFRPYVYRLARKLQLCGTVANTGEGVHIVIEGPFDALDSFQKLLRTSPPPASRISDVVVNQEKSGCGRKDFVILPSPTTNAPRTWISPDIALCDECRRELFTPGDRRFHYPFINCTNCGPRYSILETVPYDRPNTSMRRFTMCPQCEQEYNDPNSRRFHAQPNGCPACGPSLSLHAADGGSIESDNPIAAVASALAAGKIIAVKGLGGFHLAVSGMDQTAVLRLRSRKHRPAKPLAIMVRDLARAQRFCRIGKQEKEVLTSSRAPIVLLERKNSSGLAAGLAPGTGLIGLMLPYSPLHALLLAHPNCPDALVMTSGNLSGEPICIDNDEVLHRLAHIADLFLLHDRDIVTRVDDSVVRVTGDRVRVIRRGRGYAPEAVPLAQPTRNTLGCGAEKKNSFCLIRDNKGFLSQHIGKLTSSQSLDFYRESIDHMQRVLETKCERAACDLHPDYLSTRFCEQLPLECRKVQHHHAHAASVMAEHGLNGPVLAVLFDGTGYSGGKTIYGGEWYLADRHDFTRLAHLRPFPLPGGDRAVLEPWRTGLALLRDIDAEQTEIEATGLQAVNREKQRVIRQMLEQKLNTPLTSSCGRLFDGIAALLGLCLEADYEAQAAMQLEHQASLALEMEAAGVRPYQVVLLEGDEHETPLVLDTRPLVSGIMEDLRQGIDIPALALAFHHWLIRGTLDILTRLREQTGIGEVVLSGGVMQNKILMEGLLHSGKQAGFTLLSGEQVPVNDGGIALGQAYIAGCDT